MERENGVRQLELHELVHSNAVEYTIIDLMHNLFFGTPKLIMKKWISTGLISNAHLIAMQDDADKLHKSWYLVYSPAVLSGSLPQKHFDNWMCFFNACWYLAMPSLTYKNLAEAHFCLELFG
ncbi:hypothetical protein PHYBLDRAFT_141291 [Phycomyces blakesleeanus NRRL 1555(-)]|uniref:Uncharacterized protein n=1 Tax=Phycomyces blakesleeanus (strain ATCC 8743b / DSM 1359 / FGSC 10004 / NBRC 33097 / NRRL 1555) TaxID=763407 RepID=A0A167P7G9_PHYB8|nr:hypothetical protein PHYBLDRAFT_141291 [Phycomyces blakesleeanus NRRL 1555(-)]OAD77404.1 hypothetical protein PHYBLDRAFT_141291 [Phycomyces blakesleeanus NRRL 1555(-)]|eukprot:XP_018295444.1 hypothetical protein PHYBLDRAFT_141291 [Phycomyces blakesleeanus NRRL 1555(-)]